MKTRYFISKLSDNLKPLSEFEIDIKGLYGIDAAKEAYIGKYGIMYTSTIIISYNGKYGFYVKGASNYNIPQNSRFSLSTYNVNDDNLIQYISDDIKKIFSHIFDNGDRLPLEEITEQEAFLEIL